MKIAAKVFLILGMVAFCYLIFPIPIGIIAYTKIDEAKDKEDYMLWGILATFLCSLLGGIFMLLAPAIEEKNSTVDVKDAKEKSFEDDKTKQLRTLKKLYEDSLITEEDYNNKKKQIIDSL